MIPPQAGLSASGCIDKSTGRKKALEHFLENKFIFQTDEFRTKYEDIARANIQKEMEQL